MVTPVSGSALNFSASGVAANSNPGRYAVNGALNLSFSDLLHAQSHYDSRAPAPLADTRPTPTRPSSPETSREPSRTHDSASSPAPRPSPPPQEPARANDSPRKTEQTRKQPAKSQEQANTETGNSTESSEKASGIITTGERTPQPQHEDAAVLPGLPATIAVLLNGIAGEIAEDVPGSDADPEAFRDASTHTGRPRTPMTDGGLSTRAATPADDYTMQGGEDMENDAEGQTKPNTSSPQAGRDSTAPSSPQGQTVAPSGTGNESTARINAASVDTAMNPASVNPVSVNPVSAASITPHENGGARTAPTGITTGAPDISLLNPPRLPTQAGAVLPQFTIPTGAGQRTWAEEIGNRVMWMLGRAESRAELILTPPLLGKVEISIQLNGDQSTAQFLASSQSAREALEQALPRLRELLAQAGINLGEASVNTSAEDRTQAQDGKNTHHASAHRPDAHHDDDGGDAIKTMHWSRPNSGLVDTFA